MKKVWPVLMSAILALGMCACSHTPSLNWQEQMGELRSLAEKASEVEDTLENTSDVEPQIEAGQEPPEIDWIVPPTIEADDIRPVDGLLKFETYQNSSDPKYQYVKQVSLYQKDGLYGLIDFNGIIVAEPEYTGISSCVCNPETYLVAGQHEYGLDTAYRPSHPTGGHGASAYIWNVEENLLFIDMGFYGTPCEIVDGLEFPMIIQGAKGFNGEGPFQEYTGLYGFAASANQLLTPIQYENANPFSGDRAAVRRNGKWGFIDRDGKQVIDFIYDDASREPIEHSDVVLTSAYSFSEGVAAVHLDGKWGFIDRDGDTVVPLEYEATRPAYQGKAWVKQDGKWGVIKLPANKSESEVRIEETAVQWVLAPSIEADDIHPPTGPLKFETYRNSTDLSCRYTQQVSVYEKDGRQGLIDFNGTIIVEPQYSQIFSVWDAYIHLRGYDRDSDGQGYEFDQHYQPILSDGWFGSGDLIHLWSDELKQAFGQTAALCYPLGEDRFIPPDIVELAEIEVEVLGEEETYYSARECTGQYGFAYSGTALLNYVWYENANPFSEERAAVRQNGKWGYIDTHGNQVIDFIYDDASYETSENSDVVLTSAYGFSEGVAAVCLDGKWGLIDRDGNTIVPFEYEATRPAYQGKAWVKQNGKWGIIQIPEIKH